MQKQVKYTRIVGWCYILYNTNLGKSEVFQHYIDFLAWYFVLFSVFETIVLTTILSFPQIGIHKHLKYLSWSNICEKVFTI